MNAVRMRNSVPIREKSINLKRVNEACVANEILMFFRAQKRIGGEISLSDPIDTDKDGNTLALMDVICADDTVLERIDSGDDEKLLYRYVSECLDDRERQIIRLRYGLGGAHPCTQREIAQLCGISRSYVSRIEKRSLKKLEERFNRSKK
jgi:RNA polymerase sporulation-specific sigma factor